MTSEERKSNSDTLKGGYWRGFMSRHGNKIFSLKSRRFSTERSNWITYENIELVYDLVYKQMLKAGVVERLDETE